MSISDFVMSGDAAVVVAALTAAYVVNVTGAAKHCLLEALVAVLAAKWPGIYGRKCGGVGVGVGVGVAGSALCCKIRTKFFAGLTVEALKALLFCFMEEVKMEPLG